MISFESYTFTDSINPNVIGLNPYVGYLIQQIPIKSLDDQKLNQTLIDYHFDDNMIVKGDWSNLTNLNCNVDIDQHMLKLGNLINSASISIVIDSQNKYYLIVNAGGNTLGNCICNHYQSIEEDDNEMLRDDVFEQYLDDMKAVSRYAKRNRELIAATICKMNDWIVCNKLQFETVHNTIEIGNECIIRKNMVSAFAGQRVLIPSSVGYLDCTGLGNRIWNYSAPCCLNRSDRVYLNVETVDQSSSQTIVSNPFNVVVDGSKLNEIVSDTIKINDHWKTVFKFN